MGYYPKLMSRAYALAYFVTITGFAYACSPGTDSVGPEDDGVVITGVGGGVGSSVQSSSAATMPAASSSSGSGAAGGSGGSFNCPDAAPHEPNESEGTAFKLKAAAFDECDSSGDSVSGKLAGANDVDWFFYEGDNDATFCIVDPGRSLTQSEGGAQLCKYFECKSDLADTDLTCPSGTTTVTSPDNRPGCCGNGGFTVDEVQCANSIDDDMFVYIRLVQPNASAATCNAYTLSYHF
jgi:hypothetical protein